MLKVFEAGLLWFALAFAATGFISLWLRWQRRRLPRLNAYLTPYTRWCVNHRVSHAHCPDGCEHPQPFVIGETLFCGRCYHAYDQMVEMKPCTHETCPDKLSAVELAVDAERHPG